VFVEALERSPQASLRLLRLLAARLRATNRLMGDVAVVDLPARIARQLYEVSSGGNLPRVKLALLAEAIGMNSDGLRRALRLFEAARLVQLNGEYAQVLDPEGLQRLAAG
jgi:CRP-like cAMP-binding protein